jgi:dynactin 5
MDYLEKTIIHADEFILTGTGNFISRASKITDPKQLEIPSGKVFIDNGVIIHSNIAGVQLQRYCILKKGVVITPSQTIKEPIINIKVTIGSNTFINENAIIEAARIGSGCTIGRNCKISARCILKDYVLVFDNTVILPDTVIPPFSIVAGNPGKIIGEQSESTPMRIGIAAVDRYRAIEVIS